MKYQIRRMGPEFKAITYSLLVLHLALLYALVSGRVNPSNYAFGYGVLLLVSLINSQYRAKIVDESKVTLDD